MAPSGKTLGSLRICSPTFERMNDWLVHSWGIPTSSVWCVPLPRTKHCANVLRVLCFWIECPRQTKHIPLQKAAAHPAHLPSVFSHSE